MYSSYAYLCSHSRFKSFRTPDWYSNSTNLQCGHRKCRTERFAVKRNLDNYQASRRCYHNRFRNQYNNSGAVSRILYFHRLQFSRLHFPAFYRSNNKLTTTKSGRSRCRNRDTTIMFRTNRKRCAEWTAYDRQLDYHPITRCRDHNRIRYKHNNFKLTRRHFHIYCH